MKVLKHFSKLNLEERKMYVTVFSILVNKDYCSFSTGYLMSEEGREIIQMLVDGYKENSIALNCGIMLRECIQHRCIHEYLLDHSEIIEPIFTVYSHSPTFEIASDAFNTIQSLLRSNKQLVSKKMNAKGDLYKKVFGWYSTLINSNEYVTCRMSLQLLNEFLLDKVNFDIMIAYISDVQNLVNIMNVLRTPQDSIQYEAFHVFKVFVANPDKTPEVKEILKLNSEKLITFLLNFLPKKDNEHQFFEEKKLLIKVLKEL